MVAVLISILGGLWTVAPGDAVAARDYSPHRQDFEQHRAAPTAPWLLEGQDEPIIPLATRGVHTRCHTVYGYLPYWASSSNLHYDQLTHIACFSVEVNANGSLGSDHGWPWTTVINNAHANGVKVILVATLFDSGDIYTLITNSTYKNNFFANIKAKMLEGNADGLNIDFESGTTWVPYFPGFMADLTAYLHAEIPGSEVTFAGPAVDWSNAWDFPALAASCDGIFIMGYAFWGSWSTTTGPNAPLVGGTFNITDTVLDQYAEVTQNNPEKLILGVPYYGHHWTTTTSSPRSEVISFVASSLFYNDEPNSQTYGLLWDSTSQTPWYRYQQSGTWHQVWFDNATSLGMKYDLAIQNGLQGVGMWALGYEGARPELWDLLADRFSGCGYCCDLTGDGSIDMQDWLTYAFCMLGPDNDYVPGNFCLDGDADDDLDIDLHDFRDLQIGFGH